MARHTFFTKPRREFIARAIMDMVKLLMVAAFAGGLWLRPDTSWRLPAFVALVSLFAMSVAILPSKRGD